MRATLERGWSMREVTVQKSELLQKVRANREKHIREYAEACAGYKSEAIAKVEDSMSRLKDMINALREGEVIALATVAFNLKVPQDHSKDYDQAITMLEMSVDDKITLKSDEFACYVMDDWDWRQEWEVTKSTYANNRR